MISKDVIYHFILFSFCFSGEGFHNYHHTFPFDYSTSEFGYTLNITTLFIDLMCFLGLASDRKKVSKEMITARIQRTGDGSIKSGWDTVAANSVTHTDVLNQDWTYSNKYSSFLVVEWDGDYHASD